MFIHIIVYIFSDDSGSPTDGGESTQMLPPKSIPQREDKGQDLGAMDVIHYAGPEKPVKEIEAPTEPPPDGDKKKKTVVVIPVVEEEKPKPPSAKKEEPITEVAEPEEEVKVPSPKPIPSEKDPVCRYSCACLIIGR